MNSFGAALEEMKNDFPAIGDVVGGRYALKKVIGRGGFGVVYAARDRLMLESVAVKILTEDRELFTRRRVWREAAVMRLLDLPGVVQLRDQGVDNGHYYLVMTLAQGAPFPGKRGLTWEEMAPRVRSFLSVLALLHDQGVIHGDLKPSNVLVDDEGGVTLLDFGVAHTLDWEQGDKPALVRGTAAYIAPEIWQGEAATPASDIFAVGVIIYEALHGERLYQGDSVSEVMRRILMEPVPNLRFGLQGIPAEVRSLLGSMLAKFPDWRPANASVALDFFDKPHGVGWWGKETFRPLLALRDRKEPLQLEDLNALFGGREELFGARTGAATELWRRTLGAPDRVVAELEDWIERRVARIQGERLVLKTGALQRLRAGALVSTQKGVESGPLPEEEELRELLRWLVLMHPHRDWAQTARFTGLSEEKIEAAAREFVTLGLLPPAFEKDAYRPHPRELFEEWSLEEREEAHRKMAAWLPEGHRQRFFHLTRAGDAVEAAREAIRTAKGFDQAGETDRAVGMLQEGWLALGEKGPVVLQHELMKTWSKIALATGEPGQLERALVAMEQIREQREEIKPLEELLRSALLVTQTGGESAYDALTELEAFEDWELELRRQMYRLQVSPSCKPGLFPQVLEEIQEWAKEYDFPEVRGTVLSWTAKKLYQQGKFRESAQMHLEAARLKERLTARLSSLTSAISGWLEALELEEARLLAMEVFALAKECRQPKYQARAKYLLRAISYRMGELPEEEPEFLEALEELGVPELLGLVLLNEAAGAFRRGEQERARTISLRAMAIWGRTRNYWGARLAKGLAIRCGASSDWVECAALIEVAEGCPLPMIGAQIIGLLASQVEVIPPSARRYVEAMAKASSEQEFRVWREVLSLEEVLLAVTKDAVSESERL